MSEGGWDWERGEGTYHWSEEGGRLSISFCEISARWQVGFASHNFRLVRDEHREMKWRASATSTQVSSVKDRRRESVELEIEGMDVIFDRCKWRSVVAELERNWVYPSDEG